MKEDLNIDDFGDMDSDEDDFQALGSNFMPPKPPAQPQYNLVPYGFLRDDDELVHEDYDGVPLEDTVSRDSSKKHPLKSSPHKPQSEEIRGDPITVLNSRNRHVSNIPKWPSITGSQDSVSRKHLGLGSSSRDSNIAKISDHNQERGAGRWDKKILPAGQMNSGTVGGIPSLMGLNKRPEQNFVPAQEDKHFRQPGNSLSSSLSFVRANDDTNPFIKASKSSMSSSTTTFSRGTDDSDPFIKMSNKPSTCRNSSSFLPSKDDSNSFLQVTDNTPHWDAKLFPAQSSTPVWTEQGRSSSQNLKGQTLPGQKQRFTPTGIASTTPQIDLLQAAALQQALAGLTQLSSQSGLNLLGTPNLLVHASQNPSLAAALVGTGLGSIQPNTIEAILKSAGSTAVPVSQPNLSVLTNPPRSNIIGNSSTKSLKMPIPDGSGATRYPAPDVSSLVFDPSTGYRFDASTGLHYDANSGYFFNNELKIYLRWDKFTQTYLRVDNPPGVPRFSTSSTERMSYVKGSSLPPQDIGQPSSSFSNSSSISKKGVRSSNELSTGSFANESFHGLAPLKSVSTSSIQKERPATIPSISTLPIDVSKPPPLMSVLLPDSRYQQVGPNSLSASEQKAAALPNFAETSLFNKLRKAKLAQTAQMKSDRQRWGSPDPLLEAAQKHAADTDKSRDDVLNLKEILQRSRQFMEQKTGNPLKPDNETVNKLTLKNRSRSGSGDRRKIRSRSRSVGRPVRRSRSPGRPGNRSGRSGMSPQPLKPLIRSPDSRLRDSRGRRPNSRGHGKPSLSPARKKRSISRSRSPKNRERVKPSSSTEGRRRISTSRGRSPASRARGRASQSPGPKNKRPVSRGRSPVRRRGKSGKSPGLRQRRPISRNRSSEKRPGGPLGKTIHGPRTPDRSQSPKVKVVLNQSHGGSKIRVSSPARNRKRSADRGLSAERRAMKRKLSPGKGIEGLRAISSVKSGTNNSVEIQTGITDQRSVRGRLGIRENKGERSGKDKVTELKPIPYETPQSSSTKSSGSNKNKDVFDYKSLSNLRNQAKDKLEKKEPVKKLDKDKQHKDTSSAGSSLVKLDLTQDCDDGKQGRANHRLVSERTFTSGWDRTKPNPVLQALSPKKISTKTESRDDADNQKQANKNNETEDEILQEPDEYDFLNDTLDDDKESTIIDEYEEILDYQDLEGTSEPLEKGSPSKENAKPDTQVAAKSLSKESIQSPVIDLCIDPIEPPIEASTSAESNLEIMQSSQLDGVDFPSGKSDSLGDTVLASQSEEDVVLVSKDVRNESEGQLGKYSPAENLKESFKVLDSSSSVKDIKVPGISSVGICKKEVPSKSDDLPTVKDVTKTYNETFNAIDKTVMEVKAASNNYVDESKTGIHALGPDVLEDEEWNIVDSVDDHDEVNTKPGCVETNDSTANPHTINETQKIENGKSNITAQNVALNMEAQSGNNKQLNLQSNKEDTTNDGVVKGVVVNREEDKKYKACSENEREELPQQVRSVSDIEKFLLLSSQEVEAKREQGIEPSTSKTEKKSDIFSRLGEKLPAEESEPVIAQELPDETLVPSQSPTKTVPSSAQEKGRKGKTIAASNKPKTPKNVDLEDPVGMLFNDDKPTSTILIGPMNFIEPLHNFQHFTQIYILRLLSEEKLKVKKVFVCHEDVTGAPYHYVLIMFHTVQRAADWLKKHKGRFKADPKLFKRVAGHTKQKLIPNAETFLHFTESNWVCKVCKKGNFPPRSLCFGCFQNKDPKGFSPVKILDVAQQFKKTSSCVGTPKLKFFVTKEKVLESAPPLDGFDIKRIEMIMDEKMGFPAGICVFEMCNTIDAGKLKKYLNRREIEAVSVELLENPNSGTSAGPTIAASRQNLPVEGKHLVKLLPNQDAPISVRDTYARHPEERGERGRYQEGHGILEDRPPRFTSREGRARSPSPFREVRVPRGRSPGPSQDVKVPRGRSPSPARSRLSRDRIRSYSPRRHSPGYQPRSRSPSHVSRIWQSPESRSVGEIPSRGRTVRAVSSNYDVYDEPRQYRSRERLSGYRSPGYQSPPGYRSRSPVRDAPIRHSRSPRYRSPSLTRPVKPDGKGDWRYPPPDPKNFKFEPKSGLDYDSTTTLYYEPKSCCFYNDDTNEWLEYDPRSGRYILVR